MRDFVDSTPLLGDGEALRARLEEQSHLFFPGLLPSEDVMEVRRAVTDTLARLGWFVEGTDPMDARPGPKATGEGPAPTPTFHEAYAAIQSLQAFHELAHAGPLVALSRALFDDEVLVHPRKICRITPGEDGRYVTPPHQDYPLIQGTVDVLTAWLPLGDCPDELGGLRVLAGSHRRGLAPIAPANATGGVTVEAADDDPRWTSADFVAGDVLVFHSLTVHAAKPNRSGSLRLSADYRYQPLSDPVVEGSLLPHYYPQIPAYPELTAGWSDDWSVRTPDGVTIIDLDSPATVKAPQSRLVTTG